MDPFATGLFLWFLFGGQTDRPLLPGPTPPRRPSPKAPPRRRVIPRRPTPTPAPPSPSKKIPWPVARPKPKGKRRRKVAPVEERREVIRKAGPLPIPVPPPQKGRKAPTPFVPRTGPATAEKELRMVPMPHPGPAEVEEATRQLSKWSDGRRVNRGTGEDFRQYRHTRHGDKKAVEVWVRANQRAAKRRASAPATKYPLTIRKGNRGDTVKQWQTLLHERGYGDQVGNIDGIFGPMTEAATKRYQSDNDLTVDGIVGPQTWGHALG